MNTPEWIREQDDRDDLQRQLRQEEDERCNDIHLTSPFDRMPKCLQPKKNTNVGGLGGFVKGLLSGWFC
jgi:hypothetical protein